jgi:hypothetical protein
VTHGHEAQTRSSEGDDARFFVSAEGPGELIAFVEDDGATGTLYVYDWSMPEGERIKFWSPVYVLGPDVDIRSEDVRVEWSSDGTAVAAFVRTNMRAVIDIHTGDGLCKTIRARNDGPITEPAWLKRFGA